MNRKLLFLALVLTTASCEKPNEQEETFNLLINAFRTADSSQIALLAPRNGAPGSLKHYLQQDPFLYIHMFSEDSLELVEGPRINGDTIIAFFKGQRKLLLNQQLSYYRFQAILARDTTTQKIFFNDVEFDNLAVDCYHKWERYPSSDIETRGLKWRTSPTRQVFLSGEAEFRNISNRNLKGLDFQIRILLNGTLIFSKTKSYNQDVPPGDIFNVEIGELENFYAGQVISKKEMNVEIDILQIRPVKESKECVELDRLDKLYNAKTS